MELIISGYGMKPSNTVGLYSFQEKSEFQIKWQEAIDQASFVCQGDGYLFVVTEEKEFAEVHSYQRIGEEYRLVDQKRIVGGYLCHLVYSSKNKALFGACYETGTIFSLRVLDGKFGDILFQEIQHSSDPKALTRAHCVLLNRQEDTLITVNIALDQLYFYSVNEGFLVLTHTLEVPKGVGPRHAILSEEENYLYIITEYSNEILVYSNDVEKKLLQKISTLPENYSDTSNCSTLCFAKNQAFLYAANRGADTIALFSVLENGCLNWLKEYDCGGKHPRHMIISQDGNYLIVDNQNSNNVSVFLLDANHGIIREEVASLGFSTPSGVLEIETK